MTAPAKSKHRHLGGIVRARETEDWHGSRFLFGSQAKARATGDDWLEEPDDELQDLIQRCREGGTLRPMEG